MGFLTIENYDRLNWSNIGNDYYVKDIIESDLFYDFICLNKTTAHSAVIGLWRKGHWDGDMNIWLYSMLWNGVETVVWVSSDWISNKDNMIGALKGVIEEHPF